MKRFLPIAAVASVLMFGLLISVSEAQPPKKGGKSETVDEFVAKLMAFNKAKDGKLTKQELTDTRLHALFDRADTKKNGYVTRPDLETLFAKESLPAGGDFGKKKKGPPPRDEPK